MGSVALAPSNDSSASELLQTLASSSPVAFSVQSQVVWPYFDSKIGDELIDAPEMPQFEDFSICTRSLDSSWMSGSLSSAMDSLPTAPPVQCVPTFRMSKVPRNNVGDQPIALCVSGQKQ